MKIQLIMLSLLLSLSAVASAVTDLEVSPLRAEYAVEDDEHTVYLSNANETGAKKIQELAEYVRSSQKSVFATDNSETGIYCQTRSATRLNVCSFSIDMIVDNYLRTQELESEVQSLKSKIGKVKKSLSEKTLRILKESGIEL